MARKKREADQCPKGFYRFTNAVPTQIELRHWEQHFNLRGIKTLIIKTSYNYYVLCREGSDHYVDGT
jgi:hypothetical protein